MALRECGHQRPVQHDPPWQDLPWVDSVEGGHDRIGCGSECLACDRPIPWRQTRIPWLCEDGAAGFARPRPARPD